MTRNKKQIFAYIFLFGLIISNNAKAALVRCGTSTDRNPCGIQDLIDGVFVIVNFLIGSATLLTIGFILYGGVRMILAVGNEKQVEDAKNTIKHAITGLIIVILAYLIVASVTAYLGIPFSDITKYLKFK